MKQLLVTMAAALLFANSVFAANYRVFYFVRGEHRDKPYEVSLSASSEAEVRRLVLRDEPKAIQIEIHRQPDISVNGKDYILRPKGSTRTPDVVIDGKAYILLK